MPEKLTLTAPIQISDWDLVKIELNKEDSYVQFVFKDTTGKKKTVTYNGADAMTKLSQINTGNFSAGTSLIKKVYQTVIADGSLGAGTITGTPD